MVEETLKATWEDYYSQSSGDTVLKDRALFEMEIKALTGELEKQLELFDRPELRILELGSGTGFLAEALLSKVPARLRSRCSYTGVDFSEVAAEKARKRELPATKFVVSDFLGYLEQHPQKFDFIIAQRSIMAVIDAPGQRKLLDEIRLHLADGGVGIFSEGTRQGAETLNRLRRESEIPELDKIWHCLYLDEDEVREIFPKVRFDDYASLYWLITRVVYPFSGNPKHNTPLHKMASCLPQHGNFGLVKLIVAGS